MMKASEAADLAGEAYIAGNLEFAERLIFWFSDALRNADERLDEIRFMTSQEPKLTGFALFDAAVAGLSEIHMEIVGLPAPRWTQTQTRYIEPTTLRDGVIDVTQDVHPTLREHGAIIGEAKFQTKSSLSREGVTR